MDSIRHRSELLLQAKDRILCSGPMDTAAELARHNLQFGVGRLLYAVRTVVPDADVRFTASRDFTVTRSPGRWGSGFSYGGLLELFTPGASIIAPEVRPNTCGVLVGALEGHCSREDLVHRIVSVSSRFPPGTWDYSRRNHFVNVYESGNTGQQIFFLHGCPEVLRADQHDRPGLYPEYSPYWRAKMHQVQTPLGETTLLLNEDAEEYWQTYVESEKLSQDHREETAGQIFGSFKMICNETHEGMVNMGTYLLGCHLASGPDRLYPLMTDLGRPAYLVSSGAHTTETWPSAGLLPHGTGYEVAFLEKDLEVRCTANGSVLYLFEGSARGLQVFRDFANVPYSYRHYSIVEQWEREQLLTVRDVLTPVVSTKV